MGIVKLAQETTMNSSDVVGLENTYLNTLTYASIVLGGIFIILTFVALRRYFNSKKKGQVNQEHKPSLTNFFVFLGLAILVLLIYKALTWVVY